MATDQHLEIINPSYSQSSNDSFALFSDLPTELRHYIWKLSIVRNRLLEITIQDIEGYEDVIPSGAANRIGISGHRYIVSVKGWKIDSKLLRVNRESRAAALSFYRVHLPCLLQVWHQSSEQRPAQAMLYLNPDEDFLRVECKPQINHLLMDFIRDIKVRDPKDVGLVNLAASHREIDDLTSIADEGDETTRGFLAEMLSNLREVIWMANSGSGRGIMGPVFGFQGVFETKGIGVRFNHSMPLRSSLLHSFEVSNQDPRAVEPDLEFIAVTAGDLPRIRTDWQHLLDKCGITKIRPPRIRALFAKDANLTRYEIVDKGSAKRFLEHEEDDWLNSQHKYSIMVERHAGKVPVESPEELSRAIRPAIGFWLFPIEAFKDIKDDTTRPPTGRRVFDLRGHSPQLALSYVPNP